MKKRLLTLLACAYISIHAFAQTTPWIQPGATWYYSWSQVSMGGNDKIEYTHDTLIGGKTCQVLETTRYEYGQATPGGPIVLLSTMALPTNYTYAHGDTVFYKLLSSFRILYNFGASVGTRWDLGINAGISGCSQSIEKVDSLSSIIISGNTHRIVYTSDTAHASSGRLGKTIEHIGSMFYLFPTATNCSGTVDATTYSFSCFNDALESYSVVAPEECENPYHVGIAELSKIAATSVYPNPATNKITISMTDFNNCNITLYNTLGLLVFSVIPKNTATEIDLSNLNAGIYFISIEDASGKKEVKRFVKN